MNGVLEQTALRSYALLLWDFDGVIKESVDVKSDAFERLFAPFGAAVARRVRQHHECNGGLSRFEKLPLYLEWAGLEPTVAEVARYEALFSGAVRQAVIDCAWVPGAREYLQTHHEKQYMAVITATPQAEIEHILGALGIGHCFREVHGAPRSKADGIGAALAHAQCGRENALLIGDSNADHQAAAATGVAFLLRRTALNRSLQREYAGPQCENFADE